MNTKQIATKILQLLIFAIIFSNFSACGSKKTTVTTTSEIVAADSENVEDRKIVTTKVVEEEESDGCSGVLGCTIGFVGDVIALPFRAVGAVIDFIF